jgi:hypothetical protein
MVESRSRRRAAPAAERFQSCPVLRDVLAEDKAHQRCDQGIVSDSGGETPFQSIETTYDLYGKLMLERRVKLRRSSIHISPEPTPLRARAA